MSIYLTEEIISEVYYPLIQKARIAATVEDGRDCTFDLEHFHNTLIQLTIAEVVNVMRLTELDAEQDCTYLGDDVPTIVHMNEIEKHFGIQ